MAQYVTFVMLSLLFQISKRKWTLTFQIQTQQWHYRYITVGMSLPLTARIPDSTIGISQYPCCNAQYLWPTRKGSSGQGAEGQWPAGNVLTFDAGLRL